MPKHTFKLRDEVVNIRTKRRGFVTSVSKKSIDVRYGFDRISTATRPQDLRTAEEIANPLQWPG